MKARGPIRSRPLRWLRAALLVCLALAARSAPAQQAPTRVLVEGRAVTLTTVPAYRDGRLFLPVFPIAQELRDVLTVDPAIGALEARLSHTGEKRVFDRTSGDVRRDGLVLASFPNSRDVVVALTPEAQLLPIEVLSFLLHVSIQVHGDEGYVTVRRDIGLAQSPQLRGRIPVAIERIEYAETLGFVEGLYGHTMRVGGRAHLYDSVVTSAVEYSGGTGRRFLNFLSGFVTVERPSGQRWTAGDFAAGARSRLLGVAARGLSLEQPLGSSRLTVFTGAALSQTTLGAGSFSQRAFHTGLLGALWTNRAFLRGESGVGLEFGGVHFADGDRRGSLLVHQFVRRGRWSQLHVDAGFGQFRAGRGAAADGGPSFGVEAVESLQVRRHSFIFRGAHYGDRFLTPQVGDSTRGRTLFSAAWSAPVLRFLNLGASAAHTRVRVPFTQNGNTYTWSANYSHTARFLPDVSAMHTVTTSSSGAAFSTLLLQATRSFARWRPVLTYNRVGLSPRAVHSSTIGVNLDLRGYGSLYAGQSFSSFGQKSGAVDWTPRGFRNGRYQLTAGLGYERVPNIGPGLSSTSLAARFGANLRLPAQQMLQFSFQQSGGRREFRITLGGNLFSRAPELALAPPGQAGVLVTPSGVNGRLYQDVNLNGRYDAGADLPLPNTRVWLDNSMLADTDAEGRYRFPAVFPGPHRVAVDVTTLRADFSALNEMQRRVDIPARTEVTLDFSFVQTGALAGLVWYDTNRNGELDPGENPASGPRILCSCGQEAPTTADGVFILGDLLPGEVFLFVDARDVPSQFEVAPKQIKVRVISGQRTEGLRFALQPAERKIEERTLPPQTLLGPQAAGNTPRRPQ